MAAAPVSPIGRTKPADRPALPDGAFAAGVDALTVGMLLCTPGGDHANVELRRIWGVGRHDVLDRTVFEDGLRPLPGAVRTPRRDAAPRLRPVRAALGRKPTGPLRAAIMRADGKLAIVRVAARSLTMPGGRGAVVTVADETAAFEVERLRDAFLGIVGHELRSPISSVLSAADLLREGYLDATVAADVAADLGSEAQRLYELVEQLIRLADVDRLGIGPNDEPVELRNLAIRTIRRWHEQRPQLRIELDSPAEVPPISGEDGYVAQVLDILLDNAAKFAAAGTITVWIEAGPSEVRLHVLDEGPGIHGSGADSIFELFHRVRSASTEAGPAGQGIGLFVARAIVTALGGSLWAANRPERGADVGFALPVAHE